jgi:predicted site-specific integrase-resolvase
MTTKIQNPIVYNMVGAAKKIGVSYNTLFRMVKGGKIKAVNIARTGTKPIYALTANDVEEYIRKYNSLQNSPKRD